MPHRTSLYIRPELLQKLNQESETKNINRNKLILDLLHSYAGKVKNGITFNKSIQYQKKSKKWKRVNVYLEINEYEFFLDIRKFLKISLSHILFLAMQEFFISNKTKIFKKFFNGHTYGLLLDSICGTTIAWRIIWSIENDLREFA